MDNNASTRSILTSVRVPIALRSRLEHLKLARAERGLRLPRLRDLILEALNALLEKETGGMAVAATKEVP